MSKKRYVSKLAKFEFHPCSTAGKWVGLYIRVSKDEFQKNEQGEKERRQSVLTQTQDAIEDAKFYGWTEYKIYDQDCDITGSEEIENRPALQELKADILAGKVHAVIARKLDRIFRNSDLQSHFKNKVFRPFGVVFKLTSDRSFDWNTEAGNLVSTITGIQNQDFLTNLSTVIVRNKNNKAQEGKLRTPPSFGYGVVEIDGIRKCITKENEAAIIQEIFQRSASGEGVKLIMNDLITRGIKSKRNEHLYAGTIRKWLRNKIYKGISVYNDKEYKSPYSPIVSEELWDKANEQIDIRSKLNNHHGVNRSGASNSHLLTGLLQCGFCSDLIDSKKETQNKIFRNLMYSFNSSNAKDENGKSIRTKYNQYRCQTKAKYHATSCPDSISFGADYLETIIKEFVRRMIENDYASQLNKTHSKLDELLKRIETVENQLSKFKEADERINKRYAAGEIADAKYDKLSLEIENNITKTEKELSGLKEQKEAISGTATKEALEDLGKWDSLTMEQKKTGLHKIFDRIKVYADRVEIYFKGSPDECLMTPIKYVKHKGYQIDFQESMDNLLRPSNYKFSKAELPPMPE